jgi:RHS repeat-associated protein
VKVCTTAILFAVFLSTAITQAQTNPNQEQGLKPYDSWHGGDLDSVSLTSGSLSLHIPLASFPQRGNLDLSFMVRFSSKQWYVHTHCVTNRFGGQTCTYNWAPTANGGTQIVSSVDWWMQGTHTADGSGEDWTRGVTAPDGNTHQFGSDSSGDTTGPTYPLRSFDATGLLHPDVHTLVLPNGTRYSFPNFNEGTITGPSPSTAKEGVQASTITDANGNQITISSAGWTDTMGRLIPGQAPNASLPVQPGVPTSDLSKCPSGTSSAWAWTIPGLAGGSRTFYFCYSLVTLSTTFQVSGVTDYPPTSTPLLTAVVLPDLTMWTFSYNNYGDVTQFTFPTGGSIAYTYGSGPVVTGIGSSTSRWVASRTVNANDGSGGNTWQYQYAPQFNGQVYIGHVATVTTPDGNDTVHTMSFPVSGTTSPYDTQVQYYQGHSSGGTLLKTVTTQYAGIQYPGDPSLPANVIPVQVTTTLPGGQTSHVMNTYDSTNAVTQQYTNGPPVNFPVVFGSVLQRDEYDFSNALVRSTINHFLWQDNSTYLNSNFISLPVYSKLQTPSGCEVSKTSFGYDETYPDENHNNVTLQSSGITTQFGAAPWPVRGNRTSTSKWLISGCAEQSAITSHTIPYDTGLPYETWDPLQHFSKYTYSLSFAGAYLTQTNLPDTQMPDQGAPIVHHIISGNYDFNTGLLTTFTDENSQQYIYSYDALMLRLAQGNNPDGGETIFNYPDPLTVTRQRLITGTTFDSYTVKFDGLGRPIQTQQVTPSGIALTDTIYDAVGRTSTVSNPYYQGSNHSTDPTYGITTTQYDALSRVIKTIKQDSSFTTVTYTDNCTTAVDESGKSRKSCADAFGRMTTVYEDPRGLNYETDYQYDTLNNLLRIDQKGSSPTDSSQWRTRLFTYDSLSRIITALNPEAGTTCYGIWSGGNCINGYDSNSNLLKKTDAKNIIVSYTYDNLNRLTDKTYSDGTPNASYRYDYSSYLGQTFAFPIGRQVAATSANNTVESFASFDAMGRVVSTVQCNPGVTQCNTFTAAYDKLGDLTTLGYPQNGFSVTYVYDTAARLTSATDSNGVIYAQNPTYLASAAMQEFSSPNFNGNKFHVDYNSRLQPVEIWAGAGQGTPALFDKQYSYGTTGANNGNIFTITNLKDSTRTQTFSYDSLNRLASAQDAAHWSNIYTYDAWGNLTKKLYGSIAAGEHLDTSATPQNWMIGYTYDAGGNMLTDGINNWTYVYDGENRIKTAGSTSYTYDADGRRVQKSSGTNYWYGPGGQVFAETDSGGNWTNYIFFAGQRLARNVNGDIKYFITDHLHSTGMFVDKAGTTAAVLDDNDFYPWGGVVPGVGKTTSNNTIKFTGQYRDGESQLDYFGARYYSNAIGRFMSPDWAAAPITVPYAKFGDPQSLNLYSYVENGPVNRIDADGHEGIFRGWDGLRAGRDLSSAPGISEVTEMEVIPDGLQQHPDTGAAHPGQQQPQPPAAQPQQHQHLTAPQQQAAAAVAYSETTRGSVQEDEAIISVVVNRAESGDHQYVDRGRPVTVQNVIHARGQFQGVNGRNARHFPNAHNAGAQNARAAAANVSQNGPTNHATAFLVTGGREPAAAEIRGLGNVHFVQRVGNVFLYEPGPTPAQH